MRQNYPNPFNPSTVISYQLANSSDVQLQVYDMLGREIGTLVNEFQPAGNHSVQLSDFSAQLPSGVYIYTLKAGDFIKSNKMTLIK